MITLHEATIDDTGNYECKAINVAGTTTLSSSIEIQQAPVITLTPDRQTLEVTEGDELRFSCVAHGIPEPTVHIKVPEGSHVRTIIPLSGPSTRPSSGLAQASVNHLNTQRSQSGLYECIAQNEAGQDLRYIQVNVNPKRGDVGKFPTWIF